MNRKQQIAIAGLVVASGLGLAATWEGGPTDPERTEIVWGGPGGAPVLIARAKGIIGGQQAAPGEAPWYAQLNVQYEGSTGHCGATAIKPRVLVTAAHCVTDDEGKPDFREIDILIGSTLRDDPHAWRAKVFEAGVHAFYGPSARGSYTHDIAFLCLPENAPAVAEAPRVAIEGKELRVFGLGATEDGSLAAKLRTAKLVVDASHPAGVRLTGVDGSFRQGDSGGPIMQGDHPVGIVSTFTPLAGDPVKVPLTITPIAPYAHLIPMMQERCAG